MKSRCRRTPENSAGLEPFGDLGAVTEHPTQLRGRERGVEIESRSQANQLPVVRGVEFPGLGDAPPALPDDRRVDGTSAPAVPEHQGLGVVGDAETGHRCGRDSGGVQDLAHALQDVGHHGLGVLFDPAGFRVVDGDGPAGPGHHATRTVEQERLGAGRPLVDADHVVPCHHSTATAWAGRCPGTPVEGVPGQRPRACMRRDP